MYSKGLRYLLPTFGCRNAHSVMSMDWLGNIADSGIPALICLTFGDRLFAEQMTRSKEYPHPDVVSRIISDHMQVKHLMQSVIQVITPISLFWAFYAATLHFVGLQGEVQGRCSHVPTRLHDVQYSYQQRLHTRRQRGPPKTSWCWNQRSRGHC